MGQNIEIVKLQVRRGPESELPTLDSGEPAITTDTNKFFIGDGTTNHQLANLTDLANVNSQLSQKVDLATLAETGRNIKVVACVLRNDGSGWRFIDTAHGDSYHSHINVSSVTADTNNIQLNFDFTAKNVLSFVACPDETFGPQGYQFGASVAPAFAVITCSQSAIVGGYIYYDGTSWNTTSTSGITSVSFSAGTLTINHQSMAGYLANASSRGGVYSTNLAGMGNTSTTIQFYTSAGTLITTPDTNMKVFFTRSTQGIVNPQNIINANGNIWCLGVLEV